MSSFYSVSLAFLVVLTVGVGATEHQLSKGRTGAVLKNPDALLLVDQPYAPSLPTAQRYARGCSCSDELGLDGVDLNETWAKY